MNSIAVVFAAGILGSGPDAISLVAAVPKSQILVGEPAKVLVKWVASEEIEVRTELAEVLVDRGQGFERWFEALPIEGDVLGPPRRLMPGSQETTEYVLGVGSGGSPGGRSLLAFPGERTYRVVVRCRVGSEFVSSNVVQIHASPPTGTDAELLQKLRQEPETLVAKQLFRGHRERLERLFADHPESVYLARPQIIYFEKLLYEAIAEAPDPIPPDAVGGDVPILLERLGNLDLGPTAFEDDRLLVLAEMRERSGRGAEARRTYRDIIARFPTSRAAEVARQRIPAS